MANKPDWKWIFGLSIDDELTWSATLTDRLTGDFIESDDEVEEGVLPYPPSVGEIDLQEHLRRELIILKEERPHIFKSVGAVGVSVIGIVDHENNRLISLRRKNWKSHDGEFIVDFNRLLYPLFDNKINISIHNDATAKCLGEYYWMHKLRGDDSEDKQPTVDSLCYALFHEGVNGAFVNGMLGTGKPVAILLHQEMGHIRPNLHKNDFDFGSQYSGCPVHHNCFEGIASSTRVEKQWRNPLYALKDHPDNPWDIIAHYIAHFCWNIVLTIPPKKIVLGGSLIFPELVEIVRTKFWRLNTGDDGEKPYIQYRELMEPDFIAMAKVYPGTEGQVGALNLARRAIMNKQVFAIDDVTGKGLASA